MARAAGLLHHVLLDNTASKQAVLEATASEGPERSLLARCCRQLANMLASGQQGADSQNRPADLLCKQAAPRHDTAGVLAASLQKAPCPLNAWDILHGSRAALARSNGCKGCAHGAGEPSVSLAVAMLLRLLITWAHDCQPALQALLAPRGHLPMLLELAQKRYLTSPHATINFQHLPGVQSVLMLNRLCCMLEQWLAGYS